LMAACIAVIVSFVATILKPTPSATKTSISPPTSVPVAVANKTNGVCTTKPRPTQVPKFSIPPVETVVHTTMAATAAQRPLKVASVARSRGPKSNLGSKQTMRGPMSNTGAIKHQLITATKLTAQSDKNQNINKGRWTADEHRLFLEGLDRYGKDFKKIGKLVNTRTVVQIRSHAQKHFDKEARDELGEGNAAAKRRRASATKPCKSSMLLQAAAALESGYKDDWTESEQRRFLQGLQQYGEDYEKIARLVATRNLVQVRTHGQQHFETKAEHGLTGKQGTRKIQVSGKKRKFESIEI